MTLAIPQYLALKDSFGSRMPDRTFVPEACSTQTLVINNYSYQDNFPNPVPLWNPVGGAAIGWAGPGAMTVNCNIPNEGVQQVLPCVPGVQNTLDLTLTFGNNDIQIMLLDPLILLPLPGYPILYPAQPFGTVLNIQLFFIGPPAGNVIVQITSPGGSMPFPDMFIVNYAAISSQTTTQQQVCWDEDYRFGFNGKEKDNEANGQGNSLDFGARIYDSRLGRWLSIDPKYSLYQGISPFSFGLMSPLNFVDINGQILRDKNGRIVYVTDGTQVLVTHPSGPSAMMEIGYIFTDDGTAIQVYRNVSSDVRFNTDCHGTTFADALYWINNDQVPKILKGDGYTETNNGSAKKGDKVLFYNASGTEGEHSGTIVEPKPKKEDTIVEGEGGLEKAKHKDKLKDAWDYTGNAKMYTRKGADKVVSSDYINQLKWKLYPQLKPKEEEKKKEPIQLPPPENMRPQQNYLDPKKHEPKIKP